MIFTSQFNFLPRFSFKLPLTVNLLQQKSQSTVVYPVDTQIQHQITSNSCKATRNSSSPTKMAPSNFNLKSSRVAFQEYTQKKNSTPKTKNNNPVAKSYCSKCGAEEVKSRPCQCGQKGVAAEVDKGKKVKFWGQ
jgi:hypothetical protein